MFLAAINLNSLVLRHILSFPTIKTIKYTINYPEEERVEIEKKK
jgi:hypothetical protein